jgi:hypothetical protein
MNIQTIPPQAYKTNYFFPEEKPSNGIDSEGFFVALHEYAEISEEAWNSIELFDDVNAD